MSLLRKLHYKFEDEVTEGGEGAAAVQTAPSTEEMKVAVPDDGSTELDFDGINSILNAPDPFEAQEESEDDTSTSSEETASAQPDGEGDTTSEPGTTETAVSTENDDAAVADQEAENPELALLRQTLEAQKTLIEQLQQGQQGEAATGTGDGKGEEEASSVPEYAFTIPDQLMSLVDSEDPAERRQGFAAMAQGVAQTVHTQMLEQVQGMFMNSVPQTVLSVVQQQNQAKAIFEDFYGTHKELNQEELKPIVVQVAEAVMKESGAKEWSPQVRDTIAARVKSLLHGKQVPSAPSAPAAPASPVAGRQSRANNATTSAEAEANDVASLLF